MPDRCPSPSCRAVPASAGRLLAPNRRAAEARFAIAHSRETSACAPLKARRSAGPSSCSAQWVHEPAAPPAILGTAQLQYLIFDHGERRQVTTTWPARSPSAARQPIADRWADRGSGHFARRLEHPRNLDPPQHQHHRTGYHRQPAARAAPGGQGRTVARVLLVRRPPLLRARTGQRRPGRAYAFNHLAVALSAATALECGRGRQPRGERRNAPGRLRTPIRVCGSRWGRHSGAQAKSGTAWSAPPSRLPRDGVAGSSRQRLVQVGWLRRARDHVAAGRRFLDERGPAI